MYPPYLSKMSPKKTRKNAIKNPIINDIKSNFILEINWLIIKVTYVRADILKKYLLNFFSGYWLISYFN